MARPTSPTLTDLELEIMRILWAREEATVPEIRDALIEAGRPLAQPSIRTMLGILQRKGHVARRAAAGRGFAYRALVSKDQSQRRAVRRIIERVFGGSPLALVSALLRDDTITKKEIAKVRRMIQEKKRGATK